MYLNDTTYNRKSYFQELVNIKCDEFKSQLDTSRNDGITEKIGNIFDLIENNIASRIESLSVYLDESRNELMVELENYKERLKQSNMKISEELDEVKNKINTNRDFTNQLEKLKILEKRGHFEAYPLFKISKFHPKRKHIGKFIHTFIQKYSRIKNVSAIDIPSNYLSRMTLLENERKLVFCDFDDQSLKVIDFNGNYLGAFNPNSIFDSPYAVCSNSRDDIFVADQIKKKIFVLNSNIELKFEFGHDLIKMPYSMAIEDKANYLYVADWRNNYISIWDALDGSYVDQLKVYSPLNVKLNRTNKLFVTSIECILVYDYQLLKLLHKIQINNWANLRGLCFDFDEINLLVIGRENKNYSQSQCLFVIDADNGDLLQITELNNTKFIDLCAVDRKQILLIRGSNKPSIYVIKFD